MLRARKTGRLFFAHHSPLIHTNHIQATSERILAPQLCLLAIQCH